MSELPPLLAPYQIRKLHPGKHQTYIYGQQRADGTACVGCGWETHDVYSTKDAVQVHDSHHGKPHDHSIWIHKNGKCPCGHVMEDKDEED